MSVDLAPQALDGSSSATAELDVVVVALGDLDVAAYDRYVHQHPDVTPYHASAWLFAVERAYGHPGKVVLAMADGQFRGVLPLVWVQRPLMAPVLSSLPFCDLAGPLADSPDVSLKLIAAARDLAWQQRACRLEVRQSQPSVASSPGAGGIVPAGTKVRMLASLPASSEALFAGFKSKLRSQIRKAEKNGLAVSVCDRDSAIDQFYPVFARNMHRLGSPVHSKGWFQSLKTAYGSQLRVGLVTLNEVPVGAGIVLVLGDRACIPWASTLAEYNRLAPNMLLYWALLADVCDAGCRQFDFGRSTVDEGTYRFKRQWGAEPHRLLWQAWYPDDRDQVSQQSETPGSPGLAARLRPVIERVWQRLPLPLANWIGPRVRKYITL